MQNTSIIVDGPIHLFFLLLTPFIHLFSILSEGPMAMLQGALLYGTLIYMFSARTSKKDDLFSFQEEPLAF
jgi:hypothetical protein